MSDYTGPPHLCENDGGIGDDDGGGGGGDSEESTHSPFRLSLPGAHTQNSLRDAANDIF